MSGLIETIRSIRLKTWDQKPEDINHMLDKNRGYTDTWDSCFFPTLYAWEETIASRNVLFVIRQSLKDENLDFRSVSVLTQRLICMYIPFLKWANLTEAESVFSEVYSGMKEIKSIDELVGLLEELILYTGRLNYWIEPLMPWNEMIGTFNKVTD